MKSKIAQQLALSPRPLAMLFANEKQSGALEFTEQRWGCIISLLDAAAAGRTVVLGREAHACMMSGGGRCHPIPPKDQLPLNELAHSFVVLKPLRFVDPDIEKPQVICMLVDMYQLSALIQLANHGREDREGVIIPRAAGCQALYVLHYLEGQKKEMRAVVGMTDPQTRRHIDPCKLSFSVAWKMFLEMESLAAAGVLGTLIPSRKRSSAKIDSSKPRN